MGNLVVSTVKKAAKLAVYVEMRMSAKNHQIPVSRRVEIVCGAISVPRG